MSVLTSLRKEWLELARTSRLLVLFIVLIFFGMTSPLLAKFTPELLRLVPGAEAFAGLVPKPTLVDSVAQFVKNTSQFGILLALLVTMGVVASEKERGTAMMVLVKPLPRGVFLLAKFIALALAFLAATLIAGLAAYYYTLFLFEYSDLSAWLGMTLLLWIYMLVYVAVTLLFSTLFRSQAAAAGASLGVLMLLGLLGTSPVIARNLPADLIAWGTRPFLGDPATSWTALTVSVILIVGSLLAAWIAFERQEL